MVMSTNRLLLSSSTTHILKPEILGAPKPTKLRFEVFFGSHFLTVVQMTSRFRKTVAALEEENREQRRQLEELHDERVTAALNERKRQATHDYRTELAIQVGAQNKQNVLKRLKEYIRAEEKDRSHMYVHSIYIFNVN